MKVVLTFIAQFLQESQERNSINVPMLISALAVLVLALGICIWISKKNKLYTKPKKLEEVIRVRQENEVA